MKNYKFEEVKSKYLYELYDDMKHGWFKNMTDDQYEKRLIKRYSQSTKVFLGGTCNNSNWRNILISQLEIGYFNPVVEDWNSECMEEEIKQRRECDFVLYVITPEMSGIYSIAEVIDDSNKRPEKTIFCFLKSVSNKGHKYFDEHQIKSLRQVGKMVSDNGGIFTESLNDVIKFLNME